MKYSVCGDLVLSGYNHRDRFSITAENGFLFYEFWTWQNKNIKQYKELCDEFSIKIAAFSGDDAFSMIADQETEAYIDFFGQSLECAEFLGADTLIVHSDALIAGDNDTMPAKPQQKEIRDSEKIQTCVQTLKKMSLMAEKRKINIAFEPLNTLIDHPNYFVNNMPTALEIVQNVGSERVKILYDIYHMQIMEGNIINTLENCLDAT